MYRLFARSTSVLALTTLAVSLGACTSDSAPGDSGPAVLTRAPLPPGAEAISFLGDTLMPPQQSEE
ncbi:MAG: hypothetical protein ACPHO4_15355, partial [Longimicrobiales bacterium]